MIARGTISTALPVIVIAEAQAQDDQHQQAEDDGKDDRDRDPRRDAVPTSRKHRHDAGTAMTLAARI